MPWGSSASGPHNSKCSDLAANAMNSPVWHTMVSPILAASLILERRPSSMGRHFDPCAMICLGIGRHPPLPKVLSNWLRERAGPASPNCTSVRVSSKILSACGCTRRSRSSSLMKSMAD
eukprot:6489089-Amphidinium_carterae.1